MWLTLILISIVTLYIIYLKWTQPRTKQPPIIGRFIPFFGCIFSVMVKGFPKVVEECRDKYGDVFSLYMLGKRITVLNDVQSRRKFYTLPDTDLDFLQGWGRFLSPLAPSGFFELNKRHIIAKALTTPFIDEMVRKNDKVLDRITKFLGWGDTQGEFEVFNTAWKLVFYLNTINFMGEEFFCDPLMFKEFTALYTECDPEEAYRRPFSSALAYMNIGESPANIAARKIGELIKKVHQNRKKMPIPPRDALQQVFDEMKDVDPNTINYRDIFLSMLSFFFGAQTNTFTALAWLWIETVRDKALLSKIMKEFHDTVAQDGQVDYEALTKMKLFESAVRETVRCYANGITPRLTLRPVHLGEYEIPAGETIILPTYKFEKNPTFFPDPHSFVAERYMDEEAMQMANIEFSNGIFGYGRHVCTGEKFAITEVKILLYNLLNKYDFTLLTKDTSPSHFQVGGLTRPTVPILMQYKLKK